jgi:crotonobetainyl-CoA:carnitine CoA-transferase CaiB-like acyl-CoA transferase
MTGYIADPAAGLMGAVAVMIALRRRQKTGKGQHIDLSQIEAFTGFMGGPIMDYTMNKRMQPRRGDRHPSFAPHGAYRCKGDDEWVTITVSSDGEWGRFCQAMGDPAWSRRPKFSDALSRYENRDELDRLIEKWTMQRDKREVMQILQQANVAAAPVLNYGEVLSDPHIEARGFFETVTRPVTGTHPYPGFPAKLSQTPVHIRKPAPTLGQDNEYILKKYLGMKKKEIAKLAEEEIIGTKPQGWAFGMEAEEAISRLKDIHNKAE